MIMCDPHWAVNNLITQSYISMHSFSKGNQIYCDPRPTCTNVSPTFIMLFHDKDPQKTRAMQLRLFQDQK